MNLREKFSTLEHTGTDWRRLLIRGSLMLFKGIFRLTLASVIQLPNRVSTSVGAVLSIILGMLIWLEWPSSAGWFLAFCLSAEIGLRGWALMMFGYWIKAHKERESTSY